MFQGCKNLSHVTCMATDISALDCTYNWLDGVSSNGIFHKDPTMTSWTTGACGIPGGWTVENIYAMTRIDNEMQYNSVMKRINELLEVVNENTPEDDIRSVELVSLSNLVADYEDERYVLGCN